MDNTIIPKIDTNDPKEVAEFVVKVLDSKKAVDIKLLHVTERTVIADYFVLCSGNSRTQLKSLCDEIEYQLELCGMEKLHTEGDPNGGWMLIDYGMMIIHVFNKETRKLYNLEKLYQDSDEIDIASLVTEN